MHEPGHWAADAARVGSGQGIAELGPSSFDTGSALPRTAEDARALPPGDAARVVERALRVLGIRKEDMIAFRIYDDHVVIIEGPVGYKRVYAFPGAGEVEG